MHRSINKRLSRLKNLFILFMGINEATKIKLIVITGLSTSIHKYESLISIRISRVDYMASKS